MARSRRRWPWLVAALLLLGVGAWIAGLGDLTMPITRPKPVRVHATAHSVQRERKRLRMPPPAPEPPDAGQARARKRRPSDPLLTALGGHRGALVFEANALWNEPMGQMLFKCLEARSPGMRKALDESRKKFHFDPLKQVDRMAVSPDHVVAFSGFFKGVDFDGMFPDQPRVTYGDHAVIYEPPPGVVRGQPYLAVWNDELLLVGQDEAALQHRIDQLEGRAPRPAPAVSPSDAYGDAYGSLPGDVIAKVVGHENQALADRISKGVSSAKVHFDASGDVSLNAGFQARDGADLQDLERSLAGALAAARAAAQAQGKTHLADLLDDARVVPRGSGFALDLQVPEQWVKDALGNCAIFGPPPRSAKKKTPQGAGSPDPPPPPSDGR